MAVYLFDASGIVKRYLLEIGSAWVRALADPAAGHEILLSRITRVEVTSAIARGGRSGSIARVRAILAQFRQDAARQYTVFDVDLALIKEAEMLAESHRLRGYDAVQLAATLKVHRTRRASGLDPLTLVSADGELNRAALVEGLAVDDPTDHP